MDKRKVCRVCGLEQSEFPWGEDGKTASFEICDCCGVEFGYEDCTVSGVLNARRRWLDSGANWSVPKSKPNEWNLESSLSQIPEEFKTPG